jgi:hypothetical protein
MPSNVTLFPLLNRETLLSVLEPFLQDPTVGWDRSGRAQRGNEVLSLLLLSMQLLLQLLLLLLKLLPLQPLLPLWVSYRMSQ